MFGKLSTLFNINEDPFTRTQEQFIEHWERLTECFASHTVLSIGDVYDTNISVHMADMIYMIETDKVPDDSDYGPCVEFILQHDILATLQQHAQNDIPTGMRRLALSFFSQLVQKLERSVLPHLNVHKPLQDMICVCGGGKYPIDEINFITSILGKFHEDPSLVNLFMNETKGKNGSVNYELRMIDALISLSHNKEDRVVKKSCESLLLCVAADSEYVIDNVLSYTILVQDLVSRLCQRYNSFQSDPAVLLSTHVTWTTQLVHSMADGGDKTTARLLLWVDYLNTLSSSSHPRFASKLLHHFSKVFLYTHVLNDFKASEPLYAVKALCMSQRMLSIATSELLLVELLKFLTDDTVLGTLCALLNNPSPLVVESTLLLFNELFETHHSVVVETLVLRHTKRHVSVRLRMLQGKEERHKLKRTNSGDSGVEEMLSDEEISFIHMDTALLSHFEPDQHSPALVRRKIGSVTSLSSGVASTSDVMTSNIGEASTSDVMTSNSGVPSTSDVMTSNSGVPSTSDVMTSNIGEASISDVMTSNIGKASISNAMKSNSEVASTSDIMTSNSGVASTSDVTSPSHSEPVSSSENRDNATTPNDVTTSNNMTSSINMTASNTALSSDAASSIISETKQNVPDSDNSKLFSHLNLNGDTDNNERSDCNEADTGVKGHLNGAITLEHNRVGSPNHFKTIIVSHDHVEEVRRPGKNSRFNIKLDQSVLKFLNIMPELSQSRMVGYREYLHDAHIRAKECTLSYSWISTQQPLGAEEMSSEAGVFLDKLVSLVLNIPYQSYTVNMLLMSLLSEVSHIPHDSVTLYLLDTELSAAPLYNNLVDVAQQFHDVFQASPTLKEQLRVVPDTEMPDICRAAFLTEEFCKELAAITLVKSTSSI